VRGLRARGGYAVDISWRGGALSKAVIHPQQSGVCEIWSPVPLNAQGLEAQAAGAADPGGFRYRITVEQGKNIVMQRER
ncbi:hypothetical protein P9847_27245, partial [Paenibacillus chibensis]|nr:hypothetical protein [Paenibacillus chibensis]